MLTTSQLLLESRGLPSTPGNKSAVMTFSATSFTSDGEQTQSGSSMLKHLLPDIFMCVVRRFNAADTLFWKCQFESLCSISLIGSVSCQKYVTVSASITMRTLSNHVLPLTPPVRDVYPASVAAYFSASTSQSGYVVLGSCSSMASIRHNAPSSAVANA